jgi:PAS domain S-box-containing protein
MMPPNVPTAPDRDHLLIVEDSLTQAVQLRFVLEEHGFSVRHARHGAEALAFLGAGPLPLAVISDINMPGMDGYELCRRLRGEPRLAGLAVVLLTSLSDPSDVVRALQCGADYFFTKPFDENLLVPRLRRIRGDNGQPMLAIPGAPGAEVPQAAGAAPIAADPRRTLGLLLSTYEAAVAQNHQLERAEAELRHLNENLEARVRERTAEIIAANESLRAENTARLRGEERLREQAELLEKAGEAIVTTDLECRVRFWNHGAARLLLWDAAAMTGRRLHEVFAVGEASDSGSLAAALAAGRDWRGEVRASRREGDPLFLATSVTVLRDAGGRPDGWLIFGSDVTEHKALEEKFLRAQRLESIGMLAAGIAHDLNNVLAPIGMASSLLRMRLSSAPDLKLIDTLEKSVTRGSGLVKQILGFAHGVSGERRSLQVKHLMRDIIAVITQTFPKSIELEERIPNDLWPVRGNATQMHQVLLNLCVNARDAMPEGGRLRVRGENRRLDAESARAIPGARPGAWMMIEVGDSGTGIPADVVARIWEPFFTTKGVGKGTGLGLSTVRGIVQTHEGFITLDTQLGKGTTFRVFLPAADVPDEAGAEDAARPIAAGRGQLVLVADDEESIREIVSSVLTSAGYAVETAADGLAAAALYAERPSDFSLLVSDHDMPGLDGAKLAEFVRSRNAGTRVLAVSGLAGEDAGQAHSSLKFGDAQLGKPFTAAQLLERVGGLLEGRRG